MINRSIDQDCLLLDKKDVMSLRASAIETVRRYDRAIYGDGNYTIIDKDELREFRRWKQEQLKRISNRRLVTLT